MSDKISWEYIIMKFLSNKTLMNVAVAVSLVFAVLIVMHVVRNSSDMLPESSAPQPHSDCTGEACSKESYSDQTDCVEDGSCVISNNEDPLIVAPMRTAYRDSYKEYTKTE